jgi:ATP-dependent DNA helicase RecG
VTASPDGRTLTSLSHKGVDQISGVGGKKRESLSEMGITSVLDLLMHYPRRYIDRTQQSSVAEMAVGEEATVLAAVKRVATRRTRNRRTIVEVEVFDGSGYLKCTFFNQPWRAKQLPVGRQVVLFGKLEIYRGRRQMTNPVVDLVGDRTGRIVPVYPQSERAGLTTWELAGWIEEARRRAGRLADPLATELRSRLDLVGRTEAFSAIHAPSSMSEALRARRRLAFDELVRLQVALVRRKRALERESPGISHGPASVSSGLLGAFVDRLPFPLTGAQRRAITEIIADMALPHPMHRLLQGDVGAGKTVVAVAAMLVGVEGGHQGALMAPTEVLAEQHHLGVRALLSELSRPDESTLSGDRPLRVELLTNRTTAKERARLHEALRAGEVDILVGTHALLTEEVTFSSLGVVVIDEQHRFGVEQRAALREKGQASGGADPDVLVMTATPIPRTAAMTVYGDLDVTVLDELPPGRTPVRTVWARGPIEQEAAWERVRQEIHDGRQAYVVCPLVEESERIEARAATEEFERLRTYVLAGLRLELLHGQMPARQKESVMASFRQGGLDVLVATTVIEVGVDVANATVMVVEDADRFGIAQLHQLRGRVGRGADASWCYLLGEGSSPEAERRLGALVRTNDGFELAEEDLELRGEGTILGTRQKGSTDLKLASLRRDKDLVRLAREAAFEIVDADPHLADHRLLAEEIALTATEEDEAFLFKS